MRFFVTAGNTQVPIDRVRSITNIFSGRTGARIALQAFDRGHNVTLATSNPAIVSELAGTIPLDQRWRCEAYRTFDELDLLMHRHIFQNAPDAVIHSAAVSDYRAAGVFAPSSTTRFNATDQSWLDASHPAPTMLDRAAGKVKSDEPELWLRLERTPKLVDKIRSEWNFRGILVKFKLEVNVADDALLHSAERSRQASRADWMVANTLEGATAWALIGSAKGYSKVSREDLPGRLIKIIETQFEESRHG